MYFYGLGTEQDYTQAFNWFLKSAEAGNQFAQYSLGSMYYYEDGVQKSFEQAVHWYEKSAKQNNSYAAYSLARMYHYGEFAEVNMKKAQAYYKIAYDGFSGIEFEDDNLWYKLGGMCKKGLGTDVNIPRAMEYFTASAELENKNALCEYGMELIKGENVDQDIEAGIKMLEKALKKGNLYAAYHLGKLYMDGELVYMDLRKAEKYLLLASENSYAQYRLGKLYLNAEKYDIDKAVEWFEKAVILISNQKIDKIHSRWVILLMVSWDKEQMVSQSLSTTLDRVEKTSFLKPRLRISFQICSIGFISGV